MQRFKVKRAFSITLVIHRSYEICDLVSQHVTLAQIRIDVQGSTARSKQMLERVVQVDESPVESRAQSDVIVQCTRLFPRYHPIFGMVQLTHLLTLRTPIGSYILAKRNTSFSIM